MSGGFQSSAFQNNAFQTGVAPPPIVVIDTHDGGGKRKKTDYNPDLYFDRPKDPFDRAGIRNEIEKLLRTAQEELPDEVLSPVEAAIREEVSHESFDPVLLAAELQRLMLIADITQSLYDRINILSQELLVQQDDEEALIALMSVWQ